MSLKHPCTVTITFPRGSGGTRAEISIADCVSGCVVAEFAHALSSLGDRPAVLTRYGSTAFGKRRELKSEVVFVPKGDYKRREDIGRKAVKPFEVDGWMCHNLSDTSNSHRVVKYEDNGAQYRVSFVRFVDATEEDLAKANAENEQRQVEGE